MMPQRELGDRTGANLWDMAHGRDTRLVQPPKPRRCAMPALALDLMHALCRAVVLWQQLRCLHPPQATLNSSECLVVTSAMRVVSGHHLMTPGRCRSLGAEVNWGIRFRNQQDADVFLTELAGEVRPQ